MFVPFCVVVLTAVAAVTQAKKPNLVFALVDDLGWNGVGFHNDEVHTPVIDKLASEGVYIDSFYTYKVCAPARGSFLSGRFPYHLAAVKTNFAYFQTLEGLNLTYTLLPKKLQDLGYSTHMVGKWHQGFYAPQYLPTSRGFDSYFGFLSGCEDHDNQQNCCGPCNVTKYGVGKLVDLYTSSGPALGQNGTNNGFLFTSAAVNMVTAHAAENKALVAQGQDEKPFFLYLALHNTHAPFQVPASYSDKYKYNQSLRNTWSGMVAMVDETVGNVTSAMKKEGMWSNTLWVMSGDNGSPTGGWGAAGSNAPLRGSKASNWEGGVRVFAFASGGVLPSSIAGTHLDGLFHICDLYKTFLAFAGSPNATDAGGPAPLDSLDHSNYLLGHEAESSRTVIIHDHFGGVDPGPGADVAVLGTDGPPPPPPTATGAIRVGDWKLLVGVQRFATWFGQFSPNMTGPSNASNTQACANGPCLFNIKNDTTEHHDLAAALPGKVSEMLKIFNSYNKKFHAGGPKGSDEDGYCAAAASHHGFMVPWRTEPASGRGMSIAQEYDHNGHVHDVDPLLDLEIESAEFASFVSGGYSAGLY